MRKIVVAAIIVLLVASGTACAETRLTDREEQELDELASRLVRMKRAVDKFANELVSSYQEKASQYPSLFGSDVRVDVMDNEKEFVVTADLPGMDKDKIVVTLENNRVLRISGTREVYTNVEGPNIVRQERSEGKFERVLELPADCKSEGIEASYKNGVLEITIPKKEPVKPETVKVRVD